MINFRYHIVSLMAVFIALSVGIAVGVSLSPSVDQGLLQQAAQDRKQVTDLRAELDRRKALDNYRNAYDEQVGQVVTAGVLNGQRVAMVAMPEAPTSVVRDISKAIGAGGTVVRDVKVTPEAFDAARAEDVTDALGTTSVRLALTTPCLLRPGLASPSAGPSDPRRWKIATRWHRRRGVAGKTRTGHHQQGIGSTSSADRRGHCSGIGTPPTPEELTAHVQFQVGLDDAGRRSLAGPNSEDIEGTDVLAARSDPTAVDSLSTVDVADLSSGVTTVVLAGKERLLGRPAQHYGALAKADAPLPELPVR